MKFRTQRAVLAAVLALGTLPASMADARVRLIIGLCIGVPSLALLLISRWQLGASFAVLPAAKELVTRGIYSKIQHPLYCFLDLTLIGLIIVVGWPLLLAAWCIIVFFQMRQAIREERVLSDAFGQRYASWRDQTWI